MTKAIYEVHPDDKGQWMLYVVEDGELLPVAWFVEKADAEFAAECFRNRVVFAVGDKVMCLAPGSWVDGKVGEIKRLNVQSSDGIFGHLLQMDGAMTVVPECDLTRQEA